MINSIRSALLPGLWATVICLQLSTPTNSSTLLQKAKGKLGKFRFSCFSPSDVEELKQREDASSGMRSQQLTDDDVIRLHSRSAKGLNERHVLFPVRQVAERISEKALGQGLTELIEAKFKAGESVSNFIGSIKFDIDLEVAPVVIEAAKRVGVELNSLYYFDNFGYQEPSCQAIERIDHLIVRPCRHFKEVYWDRFLKDPKVFERIYEETNLASQCWPSSRIIELYRFWAYTKICHLFILKYPEKLEVDSWNHCDPESEHIDSGEVLTSLFHDDKDARGGEQ